MFLKTSRATIHIYLYREIQRIHERHRKKSTIIPMLNTQQNVSSFKGATSISTKKKASYIPILLPLPDETYI